MFLWAQSTSHVQTETACGDWCWLKTSLPAFHLLPKTLHSSGIWMGLQMFTLHLCRNGEHTRCRECAGVGSHCGTSPAHRDTCRSERLALAQALEQLCRMSIARGNCQEGSTQHGRSYLHEFPKSKAQAHSSVGLESRSSGADSRWAIRDEVDV